MHLMYQKMIEAGCSQEDLISAGWFDDGNFKGKITLGFSGGFSPYHNGHHKCLELAKQHFEQLGYYVEAIIFPAHSSYAAPKSGMHVWEREQSIKTCLNQFGADWVKIEMEPALQYKREVNFPWLIDILKSKAGHGESAFVFGEDNVGFALAFIDSPVYAVCIERDGDKYQEYKDKIAKHNIKFTYLTGNNHKHESSTRIRSEGK